MTPAAAIARRHVERLYEIADVLERFLRELEAQKRRAEFYVIEGGKNAASHN